MIYRLPNAQAKPPRLDPEKVPSAAQKFIPLAEKYGISDDGYRADVIENLDQNELLELVNFISNDTEEIDKWLCGSESHSENPSKEYVTFTSLIMAAEYARAIT